MTEVNEEDVSRFKKLFSARKLSKYEFQLLVGPLLLNNLKEYEDLIDRLNENSLQSYVKRLTFDEVMQDFLTGKYLSDDQITAAKLIFKFIASGFREGKEFKTIDSKSGLKKITTTLNEDDYIFHLFGVAGSGKTTIISEIVKYLYTKKLVTYIRVCAPTHQAVNILKNRFHEYLPAEASFDEPLECKTIHSLLKMQGDVSIHDGEKIFVQKNKNKKIFSRNDSYLIIFDESSMINKELCEIIYEEIKEEMLKSYDSVSKRFKKSLKVIFLGDPAQLPPVDEPVNPIIKKAFFETKESENVFILNQVMRSANNNIINLSNYIRKWVFDNNRSELQGIYKFQGEGVKFFHQYENVTDSSWFKHLIKTCVLASDDKKSFIVLAWTNKMCQKYNNAIRQYLFEMQRENNPDLLMSKEFHKNKFLVGEHLIFKQYHISPDGTTFYTSNQVKVLGISNSITNTGMIPFKTRLDQYKFLALDDQTSEIVRQFAKGAVDMLSFLQKKYDLNFNIWKLKIEHIATVEVHGTKMAQKQLLKDAPKDQEKEIYINVLKDEMIKKQTQTKDAYFEEIKKYISNYTGDNLMSFLGMESETDVSFSTLIDPYIKDLWKLMHEIFTDCFADVSEGHVLTVHRVQSATFNKVYLDVGNILLNQKASEAKSCLYTAVTRGSHNVNMII